MGIPRLTGDLLPYLEPAVIGSDKHAKDSIIIQKLVIDGPSMVYHVYNKLVVSPQSAFCNIPTYMQLNAAIDAFLTDLESRGAIIDHVFFDGALPFSKRSVRLDRLEKSRVQLERRRLLRWCPESSMLPHDLGQDGASSLLWKGDQGSVGDSSLVAPFIVPTTIEHLRCSKWSPQVYVVPGEAETFCAAAAKDSHAAVLTNDSDLLLLADMQRGPSIVPLHTLATVMNTESDSSLIVEAQCWRPAQIMARLGLQSLLGFGFERWRDPSASFATVLQRSLAQKVDDLENVAGYGEFVSSFKSDYKSYVALHANRDTLSNLDPRLAELVCQILPKHESLQDYETWVTLPSLLEDPNKDAAWSYGRELRLLAYSLLLNGRDQPVTSINPIIEYSRKGQRITQDVYSLIPPHQLCDELQGFAKSLLDQHPPKNFADATEDENARVYIIWALKIVLEKRAAAGKTLVTPNTVRQFLGMVPVRASSFRIADNARLQDHENAWNLVHLNACVQAVLYSLRLLEQTCNFLMEVFGSTAATHNLAGIAERLKSMPPIQALFLDLDQLSALMQKTPSSCLEDRVSQILKLHSQSSALSTIPKEIATTTARSGKRKARGGKDPLRASEKIKTSTSNNNGSQSKMRSNPFHLLMDET